MKMYKREGERKPINLRSQHNKRTRQTCSYHSKPGTNKQNIKSIKAHYSKYLKNRETNAAQ